MNAHNDSESLERVDLFALHKGEAIVRRRTQGGEQVCQPEIAARVK